MADGKSTSPTNAAQPAPQAEPGPPAVTFPDIGDPSAEQAEAFLGDFKTREEAEAFITDAKSKLGSIDDLRREASEREQRYQDTINRLISTSTGGRSPAPQEAAPDNFSKIIENLPDPVEKPDDFKRALGATLAHVAGSVQQQNVTRSREAALNEFQTKFTAKHSDLSKYGVLRDAALNREADRLRGTGSDPYQAWATDPDGFMDRVAKNTREMLAEIGVDPATSGDQAILTQRPDPAGTPPANRTGGIPGAGGNMNGTAPQPGVTSFVTELKRQQAESGFF